MSRSSTSFKPGQSGNPGGRKPLDPEVKAALEAACPDAVKTLTTIVRDEKAPPKDRVARPICSFQPCGVAGYSTPDRFADHAPAGPAANPGLTSDPDYPLGTDRSA